MLAAARAREGIPQGRGIRLTFQGAFEKSFGLGVALEDVGRLGGEAQQGDAVRVALEQRLAVAEDFGSLAGLEALFEIVEDLRAAVRA